MDSSNNDVRLEQNKFRLYEHPWLSLVAVMFVSVFSIALTGTVFYGIIGLPDYSPSVRFIRALSFHLLAGFILAPFVLRLPNGKTSLRQYLADIGLSRLRPFFQLVALALSSYAILALSQASASVVFRFVEGRRVSMMFLRQVFDLSEDLPPNSSGLFLTIPSIFEEVAFRGIALTVFLRAYSERKSIIFSSIGFSLMHLLNLTNGRELVWVMGQLIWTFSIGLFYGYVFVRTRSLLPSMIVHYLGNAFVASLAGYMQAGASTLEQALYGVVLLFGFVPTTLMILWARFLLSNWISGDKLDAD